VPAATNWAGGRVEAGGASGPRPGGRHRRGGGCARRARLLGRRPRGRRAAAAGRPGGPRRGQPAGGERAGGRLCGRALCRPAGVSGLPLAAHAAAARAAGRGRARWRRVSSACLSAADRSEWPTGATAWLAAARAARRRRALEHAHVCGLAVGEIVKGQRRHAARVPRELTHLLIR